MPKLFMFLIGCKPAGRHTEQHDIFFGTAESVNELIPAIKSFWPEAAGKMHIDGWREVTNADGHAVTIVPKEQAISTPSKLFFINLGGYKKNEFEEFHYKMVIAAVDKSEAINQSKKTAFYMHTGFAGANSHVDDKYGVDVDDLHEIEDILDEASKHKYRIIVTKADESLPEDEIHLGYFKLSSFE
jgi:Domain of Unknown Function (DUF1543)